MNEPLVNVIAYFYDKELSSEGPCVALLNSTLLKASKADADAVYGVIKETLATFGLPFEKLFAFASDSASYMKNVGDKLRTENEACKIVRCPSHLLHNTCKATCDNSLSEIVKFVEAAMELSRLRDVHMEDNSLPRLPKWSGTRWTTFETTLTAVVNNFPAIQLVAGPQSRLPARACVATVRDGLNQHDLLAKLKAVQVLLKNFSHHIRYFEANKPRAATSSRTVP